MHDDALSPHVWLNNNKLVHLVTRKTAEPGAPPKDFLAGSEEETIRQTVMSFENTGMVKFYCVPTWSCPCKCPHCYVRHQLNHNAPVVQSSPDKLRAFLDNQAARRLVKTVSICFIGGEPTCGMDAMRTFAQVCAEWCSTRGVRLTTSITTSLPVPLIDDDLEFLSTINRVTVSLDGSEASHDAAHGHGAYAIAIGNLAKLCRLGSYVSVQATLSRTDIENPSVLEAFFYAMHMCGMPPERLQVGGMAATQGFSDGVVQIADGYSGFSAPCCCYRFMTLYVVHGDQLYANLFDIASSALGPLDSDYGEIRQSYMEYLDRSMAVLTERECIMCPVLGLCWGRCCGDVRFKREPWRHCNRRNLEQRVTELSADGKLLEALSGWTPDWHPGSTEF